MVFVSLIVLNISITTILSPPEFSVYPTLSHGRAESAKGEMPKVVVCIPFWRRQLQTEPQADLRH